MRRNYIALDLPSAHTPSQHHLCFQKSRDKRIEKVAASQLPHNVQWEKRPIHHSESDFAQVQYGTTAEVGSIVTSEEAGIYNSKWTSLYPAYSLAPGVSQP